MLESQQSTRSTGSSGVLVPGNIQRAWDWREGLPTDVTGAEIIKKLRVELARDLSLALLEESGDVPMDG